MVWCCQPNFISLLGQLSFVTCHLVAINHEYPLITVYISYFLMIFAVSLGIGRKPQEVLFHSDQDPHYPSINFLKSLWRLCIRQIMSPRRNCWDNELMKRFSRKLKSECPRKRILNLSRGSGRDYTAYCEILKPS